MAKTAKFAIAYDFLKELLYLPEDCEIFLVTEGEEFHNFDVYVTSESFPENEKTQRIIPIFEKRDPVVLKDWGFEENQE